MPRVLFRWNVLPVRRYDFGMEDAIVFEATLIKPLEPRQRPEGFQHVWGHVSALRAGSKLFAYRWVRSDGEVAYRCYSSYRDCFNLTEACAKEYLRATRTADGKLKPLNQEQQIRYEKCVKDIDWELNR